MTTNMCAIVFTLNRSFYERPTTFHEKIIGIYFNNSDILATIIFKKKHKLAT